MPTRTPKIPQTRCKLSGSESGVCRSRRLTVADTRHTSEHRENTTGLIHSLPVIVIIHTNRAGITRIISARPVSPQKENATMPKIKMTLAEAKARALSSAEKARLSKLVAKPDAKIDFSDQPEVTDEAIASGHFPVIGRGGKRAGAGRRALGKTRKTVKLSPVTVRRLEAYARRHKLPHFSAAIEAACALLVK